MKQLPQIALVIETSVVYGRQILAGIARYLRSHHRWSVFLEQHELGTKPPKWLHSGKWDGILSRPTDPRLADAFRRMKVPVVDLNDLYENLDLPWVGSDHKAIGAMGADHLLQRGFRHFAFCGFTGELWAAQRREGFSDTLGKVGFLPSVFESPWHGPKAPRWDKDIAKLTLWLKGLPQPLALMACNDVRGLHVLDACARSGLAVPEQVAVVGVDNEQYLCDLCHPPLSSVEPDPERIGYEAASLLDAMMNGTPPKHQRILISPRQVIVRHSTEVVAIADRIVSSALQFIREQAVHGCTVEDVLRHTHISRSVLERHFRKVLSRSPQEEIRLVRITRVKQLLLETDFTLEHIAELAGFEHPEYMSVVFKRICGQTPGAFRAAELTKLH